jgi:hypothetical protein
VNVSLFPPVWAFARLVFMARRLAQNFAKYKNLYVDHQRKRRRTGRGWWILVDARLTLMVFKLFTDLADTQAKSANAANPVSV